MSRCDRPWAPGQCEDMCRYGLACRNAAKWVTPKTKFAVGGRKVCGVHKHRHNTWNNHCAAIMPGSANSKPAP